MRQIFFAIVFVLGGNALGASEGRFEIGSGIEARWVHGMAEVQCSHDQRYQSCSVTSFEPDYVSHFVGPVFPTADKVELSIWEEDTWKKKRSEDYLGSQGRTRKKVTLVKTALFSKGFLKEGKNLVQWRVLGQGQELAKGELNFEVSTGPSMSCPTTVVYAYSDSDCFNDRRVCSEYFRKVWNRCQ